jgi:NAD(P)-dependent dehydrogenase (short-subunit alcohol dehydrogenase family)
MDPEAIDQMFKSLLHTEVTKTVHRDIHPAISPLRPELSQAGRVVLITGGGTGVGYSIARAFVRASADTVIIIGRRADVLATSAARLEEEAKATGTKTKVIARTCDVVNLAEVETFWQELATKGITVDVYIANAAKFTEPRPILELGADEAWSQMEVNVKSPLYFVDKFYAQPGGKQKVNLLSFHPILPIILPLSKIECV